MAKFKFIVIFSIVSLLSQSELLAQIKLGEDKPAQPKEPEWLMYKDIIFAPYDSLYVFVKYYPTLDAYEKYIGQQLYLPFVESEKRRSILYSDEITIKKGRKDRDIVEIGNSYIWHPIPDLFYYSFGSYDRNDYYNDPALVTNRYYSIIGILPIESDEYKKHHNYLNYISSNDYDRSGWVHLTSDYRFTMKHEETPYFVLKESESGDIVYTAFPRSFILVGGFVKIQQTFIGQNFYVITAMPRDYNIENNLIKEKWKCIDVVLRGKDIMLVMQNVDDSTKETEIKYSFSGWTGAGWITEMEYNTALEEVFSELETKEKARKETELKRAQENAAYKKEQEQEQAKRKQELIVKYGETTAEKIIAGKLEIGMSKSICKEIVGSAAVVDKTATTETWRITSIWAKGATYLYFQNDKLTRISNR